MATTTSRRQRAQFRKQRFEVREREPILGDHDEDPPAHGGCRSLRGVFGQRGLLLSAHKRSLNQGGMYHIKRQLTFRGSRIEPLTDRRRGRGARPTQRRTPAIARRGGCTGLG